MYYRKFMSLAVALLIAIAALGVASAKTNKDKKSQQTIDPLNLAVLIQDDLIPQVGNELRVPREFIRSLPQGSQVMVAYITAGSLQVRQPFTTDLEKAAKALRIPIGSTTASAAMAIPPASS